MTPPLSTERLKRAASPLVAFSMTAERLFAYAPSQRPSMRAVLMAEPEPPVWMALSRPSGVSAVEAD